MFRAAGEQAVRLDDFLGRDVVRKHTEIRRIAPELDAVQTGGEACGVQSRQQPLTCRLLIAAGAVDLSRVIEPFPFPYGHGAVEFLRVDEIILNRVGITRDFHMLHAGDRLQ